MIFLAEMYIYLSILFLNVVDPKRYMEGCEDKYETAFKGQSYSLVCYTILWTDQSFGRITYNVVLHIIIRFRRTHIQKPIGMFIVDRKATSKSKQPPTKTAPQP